MIIYESVYLSFYEVLWNWNNDNLNSNEVQKSVEHLVKFYEIVILSLLILSS